MRLVILVMISAVALASCVLTSSDMLDERTIVISGRGNAFASDAKVHVAVLREAARKGRALGYSYFAVYNSQDESRHGMISVPGQMETTGFANGTCSGAFCSGNYSATTTSTPSTAFGIVKPGVDIYVMFYQEGEISPKMPGLWSISSVLAAAQ